MPWTTFFATEAEALERVPVGKIFTVRTMRLPHRVGLVRTVAGQWRAFLDACPHKLAAFSRGGYLNGQDELVCPLHQYVFSLDTGQVVSNDDCRDMDVFEVRVNEEGALQVKLP